MWKSIGMTAAAVATFALCPQLALAGEEEAFQETLSKGWLWAYLSAFGAGLLTSLTPCVYPMIPITLAVFGARDESVNRRKAFVLATCYVFGMGLIFAALGTGFALAGGQAGGLMANPAVMVPIALLMVILATSLFGAFELSLPSGLQNRLNQVGGKGYGGAFGMGLVGGFIAAPCTGPFLAGMLIWVATTGNVAVGSTLLFTYALGVGVLFWVLAITSLSLPKSGAWMEGIKSIGGIALLAVAIHFLRPIVPAIDSLSSRAADRLGSPRMLLLVGVGLAVAGIAAGAVHLSFHAALARKVRKALGVGLTVIGVTAIVGGLLTPDRDLPWKYDEGIAYAQARRESKGVMVDFSATWCGPCKVLDTIFGQPEVYEKVVKSYVPLKFDVTDVNKPENQALQEKYDAKSLPAVIFLDAEGNEITRYNGKKPSAESFLEALAKARRLAEQKTASR